MTTGINTSFFYGPLTIAQLTETSVQTELQQYIDKYEPDYLQAVLGPVVAVDFKEALEDNVDFLRLKAGHTYMTGIGSERWDGLVRINGTSKTSPIANYIYCRYMADHASETTGTGEKIAKAENATTATPEYKIARAWNEMASINRSLYAFLTYDSYFQSLRLPYSKRFFSPINVLF